MNKYFWNMFTFLKVFRVSKYVYSNFSFNVFLASWQCWMLFLQSQHYLETPFPPKISPILHEASRYLCFALCVQFVATVSECILELSRNIAWIIYRLWRISTACCLPAFWNCNVNVMVATVKKTLSFSIQEKHMSAVASFWFSKCNALLWGMSELENRIDIDIKKIPCRFLSFVDKRVFWLGKCEVFFSDFFQLFLLVYFLRFPFRPPLWRGESGLFPKDIFKFRIHSIFFIRMVSQVNFVVGYMQDSILRIKL